MSNDAASNSFSQPAPIDGEAATLQVFKANDDTVKKIGRTYFHNDALWMALSGCGVEFRFYGKKAEIAIKGDEIAVSPTNHTRIGIVVNGERVIDDQVDAPLKTYTVFESDTAQNVTVQVIKLSEGMSTIGIHEIRVDAEGGIKPTPEHARKIEFIGDSITAGYGVDAENELRPFSTVTEDVTKTYAYKTVQALQADYSIVAYSGFGVLSGYTSNDQRSDTMRVPLYYKKIGLSSGHFDGTVEVESLPWDFTTFVPDLIVLNLGTNDDSYTKDDEDKQAEYASRYVEFLKQIRSHNTDAMILCALGIMGDRLYPFVEKAVADYTSETGDSHIATMKFDVQLAEDGYGADWHPSEVTQTKAAAKLIARIKELMNWS
ncbi:SGNH/GDSL hydrolase family protein [Gorillibacterium timonense]|uniref:SGNH/GDSL hydrolase family protein n=1 Tax=Gorillibacterium timonense TaxID=1689269 RepID=UPI0009E7B1CF|nr:SGNH/GDSL hydrolase family protein [Gorillibacterium timonense]